MFGKRANRQGELSSSCADTKQLNQLGWQAKTSLDDGIRMTLQANELKTLS